MWNGLVVIGGCVGLMFVAGAVIIVGSHILDVCKSGVPEDVKRKAHGLK